MLQLGFEHPTFRLKGERCIRLHHRIQSYIYNDFIRGIILFSFKHGDRGSQNATKGANRRKNKFYNLKRKIWKECFCYTLVNWILNGNKGTLSPNNWCCTRIPIFHLVICVDWNCEVSIYCKFAVYIGNTSFATCIYVLCILIHWSSILIN